MSDVSKGDEKATNAWQQVQAIVSATRKIAVDLGVVLVVVLVVAVLWRSVLQHYGSKRSYALWPIVLPDEAKKIGVSPEFLQSELAAAMRRIEAEAAGRSAVAARRVASFGPNGPSRDLPSVWLGDSSPETLDIVVPETGISIASVQRLLKTALDMGDIPIRGRILCGDNTCNPDAFVLSLTVGPQRTAVSKFNISRIDASSEAAAMELFKVIDPYVAAVREFRKKSIFAEQDAILVSQYGGSRRSHALALLGIIYQGQNKMEMAKRYYDRALAENPNDIVAIANMARWYSADAKEQRRRADCEDLAAAQMRVAGVDGELGTTTMASHLATAEEKRQQAISDWKLAVGFAQRSINIDPSRPALHNNYGDILSSAGLETKALAQFEQAVDLDWLYPIAQGNRGESLRRLGRLQESKDAYYVAISLDMQSAQYRRGLAKTLREISGAPHLVERDEAALICNPPPQRVLRQWSALIP